MTRINVTKSYLPPFNEYQEYLKKIWDSGILTNQGPLLQAFEEKTKQYLQIPDAYFHFVSNGTMALQLALRALDITGGEVITTPFSYVASTSSIMWERCQPVFVDIDPDSFCIDPNKIEAAITSKTRAILAVHVFGIPSDTERINEIAIKHHIKVIYDAAHAFGAEYGGKSLLAHGDVTATSFHATKPFHTIEGGGLITFNREISDKIDLMKRFGHNNDDHIMLGINAKASEFQAAMGLSNLTHVEEIIDSRRQASELYDQLLKDKYKKPKRPLGLKQNYSYYPILFEKENTLQEYMTRLKQINVYPRRYFFPSINEIPYIKSSEKCPISEDVARRVLCLPLYKGIEESVIESIAEVLNR